MKKTILATAITTALGLSAHIHAASVVSLKVEDVGSTLNGVPGGGPPGTYTSALDGRSGGFRFGAINPSTYAGATGWTGDAGSGVILGQGQTNPTGSFSTGFIFAGAPLVPYTFGGGMNADISGGVLTVDSIDFGGNFDGVANFNLAPDPGTLNVNFVEAGANPNEYLVSFQWAHYISPLEDPGCEFSYYGCFTARWIIEGTATVVPVPHAVWLMGSGIAALTGVARRRRRRKAGQQR